MSVCGERLRELRVQNNLTQQQLADRLGISQSAIGMYEQGRREPPIETILAMCALFNVSAGYLIGTDAGQDVRNMLNEMRNQVRSAKGLMFNGVPINSEETDKLFDAMCVAAEVVFNAQRKEKENDRISRENLQTDK